MFKLLNEESRTLAVKEYETRRLVVAFSLLSAVLLVGIAELLPSYVSSSVRKAEAVSLIEVSKHSTASADAKSLQTWFAVTNRKLALLSPKTNTDIPYELFARVISLKPAGVSLGGLLWKKSDTGAVISVSGVAKDRQALLLFQEQLNSSHQFSRAVLPVSNFAKDRDLEFELSISPLK